MTTRRLFFKMAASVDLACFAARTEAPRATRALGG